MSTSWCLALATLLAALAAGCAMRTGDYDGAAQVPEQRDWQPAPGWVSEHVTRIAPDVYFGLNEDSTGARERTSLRPVAAGLDGLLRSFPDLLIVLEGHCDDRGSKEYNRQLATRRADAVRQVLVEAGFPAARLRTVGAGNARPQCFTSDEACRQKNRRVHIRAAQSAVAKER